MPFCRREIDKATQNSQVKKVRSISFLNNFMFFDGGILAWKAYQIGEGQFICILSLQPMLKEVQ